MSFDEFKGSLIFLAVTGGPILVLAGGVLLYVSVTGIGMIDDRGAMLSLMGLSLVSLVVGALLCRWSFRRIRDSLKFPNVDPFLISIGVQDGALSVQGKAVVVGRTTDRELQKILGKPDRSHGGDGIPWTESVYDAFGLSYGIPASGQELMFFDVQLTPREVESGIRSFGPATMFCGAIHIGDLSITAATTQADLEQLAVEVIPDAETDDCEIISGNVKVVVLMTADAEQIRKLRITDV